MGVFDDKKFEQLDWMSQITEGIESELNGLLARLPDRIELDFDSIISFMDSSNTPRLSTDSVVRKIIRSFYDSNLSWEDERTIRSCFEFEASDDLLIDFENKILRGSVTLVKTTTTLADEHLQNTMGSDGIQKLSRISWNDPGCFSRANEVMELLGGLEKETRNRSARRKFQAIRSRLSNIFKNNEWRIRDTELANKIGIWIGQYIQSGNLAAFSNFCKIKVLTHQGGPIYSIEEQE